MASKAKSYLDLINPKGEDQQAAEARGRAAEAASFVMAGAVNSANQALSLQEQAVANARSATPFDPEGLVAAIRERNRLAEQVQILTSENSELFG